MNFSYKSIQFSTLSTDGYISTASARSCFTALPTATTTSAKPSAAVRRTAKWGEPDSHYFTMATVGSRVDYLAILSLIYAELLKKDGMEKEANDFAALYSALL